MATIDRRGVSVSAVDTPIAGDPNPGLAVKAPCLVATTGNITLSGLQTIDGVALAAGNRVLVWHQTDPSTNGLYNAATGPWTRTIDANSNDQIASGMQVVVTSGATYGEEQFTLTTPDPIVLGSSALAFSAIASGITAAAVAAATGDIYASVYGVTSASADNGPALLSAIAAAQALGARMVVLPAGTLKFATGAYLNTFTTPGILTVPGLKIRGQGKGVTIIDTSVANGFAIAVNPAWRAAHKSLFLASVGTSGALATNTYYLQITENDGQGNEVRVGLPKAFSVTGPTGSISVPLQPLSSGYTYNLYFDTNPMPAHYALYAPGGNASAVAGGQTIVITGIGAAQAFPTAAAAVWQEARISDLTITSSAGTAGASGISYFRAGYADVENVEFLNLKGDGFECLQYTGDIDGSFNVRILKSKFDTIGGWGINTAGAVLEFSNVLVEDTQFNLCGTAPANLNAPVTITSINNGATAIVATNGPHNFLAGDQTNIAAVAGMALPAGWYRVGETVTPTTFNLVTLNGVAVNTTSLGSYTANSGTVALAWRPPRWNPATASSNGSGGIACLGLLQTYRNLDFTQCNNVCFYLSETGSSDNVVFENVDMENTAGKGAYIAGLVDGSWNGGETLSATALGATIAGFQFGTGFPGGGVAAFDLRNLKVRSDVTPSNMFEQFQNTNIGAAFVDAVRVDERSIQYQFYAQAGQVRYVGFNFALIEGQCQFSISATNTAKLAGVGYGNAMPLHLGSTNGDGGWVNYQVPSGGITAAIAGPLTPNTQYYFYLAKSSAEGTPWTGAINPPTATAPVVSSPGGYKVRGDDPTQTYIGSWTTDGGGNFQPGGTGSSWYPPSGAGGVGGSLGTNSVAYSQIQQVTASRLLGNPTGSLANVAEISLGAALAFSGSALQTAAISGDITSSANSFATTLAANVVSNGKFRQSAGLSVVGVAGNATANVADITAGGGQVLASNAGGTSIGFTSSPTIATSVTSPTLIGGAAAGSSLTLQSTSGVGSGDIVLVKTGNNGSVITGRFTQTGLGINTNGNPVVDLQVGGASGNAGFEIVSSSSITTQAFNRTTGFNVVLSFSGANVVFNSGSTASTSETLRLGASLVTVTGQFQTKQGSVALANGLNSNIATPTASWVRLTGPTGAFSIGGFTGGVDGQELVVYNTTAQTMTIVNEDVSSTAGNRLKTLTGGNVVLRANATSSATFRYDANDSRWILTATN